MFVTRMFTTKAENADYKITYPVIFLVVIFKQNLVTVKILFENDG